MHRHIEELMGTYPKENLEQRLIQELAIYIDKYDIGEELARLYAHRLIPLNSTLQGEGDIGKTLNFIIQEMQREANTLGSKFSTAQSFPLDFSYQRRNRKMSGDDSECCLNQF